MLARLARIFRSLLGTATIAGAPLKTIAGLVVSIIIPYLLYAFLGGVGITLLIFGIGWLIWWMAKKEK